MTGRLAIVGMVVLGCLAMPLGASAQIVPPAGSAGAGSAPVSGIPYGPANPSSVGDPSGVLNASRAPSVGSNAPASTTTYGSAGSASTSSRTVRQPYIGATQRIAMPRKGKSRRTPLQPRGRVETSKFTGICRGC